MKRENFFYMVVLFGLLSFPLVSSLDYEVARLNNCIGGVNISLVNTTMEVDEGEYGFLNCSQLINNEWMCICNGTYYLILQTKINTVNEYEFNITYTSFNDVRRYGHSRVRTGSVVFINVTNNTTTQQENVSVEEFYVEQPINENVIPIINESQNDNATSIIEMPSIRPNETSFFSRYWWIFVVVVLMISAFVGIIIWDRRTKVEDLWEDEEDEE